MSNVNTKMTAIADAIRSKTGKTDALTLDQMASEVNSLELGIDTSDASATANDMRANKTAYANGKKITGNIETFDGSYECSDESTGGDEEAGTCTVTFNNTSLSDGDCYVRYLAYVTIENGMEYNRDIYLPELVSDYTIQNVKCGSLIFFVSELYSPGLYAEINGSAVLMRSLDMPVPEFLASFMSVATFVAPIIVNENCTIRYAHR